MKLFLRYKLITMLWLLTFSVYVQGAGNHEDIDLENSTKSTNTRYARSPDGTKIAFDLTGHGPALILLHGGGGSRQDWHDVGYVDRLKDSFQVIAIDIRGHGESDKPTDPTAYTTEKLVQDVLSVADTCGAQNFFLWGFSYGANIGRYLAVQSERVTGFGFIGINFGRGAEGDFRLSIKPTLDYWKPILKAQRENTLDWDTLSEEERVLLREHNLPVIFSRLSAMLEWSAILPKDILCPTLWLIGSKNAGAMASLKEYEKDLPGSQVKSHVIDGLTHEQELSEIDKVLPILLKFTHSVLAGNTRSKKLEDRKTYK